MKGISLWQPWTSLVAIGAKPFETRSKAPPAKLIGQRIAIHAARRIPTEKKMLGLVSYEAILAMQRALAEHRLSLSTAPRGVILCTAVLYNARRVPLDAWRSMPPPDLFGDYSPGRWIWELRDVQQIPKPVPFLGRQGWFDVPDSLLSASL